jgi:hypothetical protein
MGSYFVFIFLYFVSLSTFILDLLCLVYCGFSMCVFIFLYFVSRSPLRHKRSKIKGDKDKKYKNTSTNKGTHSTQDTRDLK